MRENHVTASLRVVSSVLVADSMSGRKPHNHSASRGLGAGGGRILIAGELQTLRVSKEGAMLTFHFNFSLSIKTRPRQGHTAPAAGAFAAAVGTDRVGSVGFQTVSLPGTVPPRTLLPTSVLKVTVTFIRPWTSLFHVYGAFHFMLAQHFLFGGRTVCSF